MCKTIVKTGFYPTILKCPELGPEIYLTEQVEQSGGLRRKAKAKTRKRKTRKTKGKRAR